MKSPHGAATRHDEEPTTPMWLPALGVAFFVGVAIVLATLPEQPSPASGAAAPTASAAPSPPGGAAARPAPPQLPAGHP